MDDIDLVREAAAEALGKFGELAAAHEASVAALLVHDDISLVRLAALEALCRMEASLPGLWERCKDAASEATPSHARPPSRSRPSH